GSAAGSRRHCGQGDGPRRSSALPDGTRNGGGAPPIHDGRPRRGLPLWSLGACCTVLRSTARAGADGGRRTDLARRFRRPARIATERDRARTSALEADKARNDAEVRVDELLVEKARALLDRDPTRSIAWLKRPRTTPLGAATIAAWAEERGVAEQILRGHQE